MKTEQQIKDKIKEHEDKIEKLLAEKSELWNDITVLHVENYLKARKALLWVLSEFDLLSDSDSFERKAYFEITCYESSKIF